MNKKTTGRLDANELAVRFWFAASAATPTCPGDLDGDRQVGLSDLLIVLADFGCTGGCPADADNDGNTGLIDLLMVLSNFGVPCNGRASWQRRGQTR